MDNHCLNIIEGSFEKLQEKYLNSKQLINSSAFDTKVQIKQYHYRNEFGFSSLDTLLSKYTNWSNPSLTPGLKAEIKKNIAENNINQGGYFAIAENIFEQNFNFIKENFNTSLNTYFNNGEKVSFLQHQLWVEENPSIKKNDFLLAIELDFIFLFEIYENLFKKYWAKSKKFLIRENYLVNSVINNKYIKLNENVTVEKLYEFLQGKLISITFQEFEKHFSPNFNPDRKINWSGTLTQLAVLYTGGNYNDKNKTHITGIAINEASSWISIKDHFCKESGMEFNTSSVKTTVLEKTLLIPSTTENRLIKEFLNNLKVTSLR